MFFGTGQILTGFLHWIPDRGAALKEKYQVLTIITCPEDVESYADLLWSEDCLGFEEIESAGRLAISAWFPAGAAGIRDRLRSSAQGLGLCCHECSLEVQEYDPSEWVEKFNRSFSGIELGDSFFIHPPWIKPSARFPINILLEPGHAFGTGTHESTQLAMLAMAPVLVNARTFLDVGTGSGILAVAAGKINSRLDISVCDIDPMAVESAVKTLRENGTEDFKAVIGGAEVFSGSKFQVLAANLTSPVIISLQRLLADLAEEYLVISGFTEDQKYITLEYFLGNGFELDDLQADNGWIACRLRKTSCTG